MSKLKPYDNYQPVIYDYVSQLPQGWKLLPNIAIFQERKEKNSIDMDTLSISAIKGIVKASDYEDRKDRTSEDKSEYLIVHKDDVAYNTMLMWAGAVGRSDFDGIVSPAYTVLKPKYTDTINTRYYHYMFRTTFYKNYVKRFSYGIVDSRLRLYYTYFKRMYSIVPPLDTQNTIVEYLNRKTKQIQEFASKKERLIELLEEKKKKIISSRMTYSESENKKYSGVEWIGDIPAEWNIFKLKYLVKGKLKYGANEEAKEANIKDPRYIRITDFGFDGKLHDDTFRSLPMSKAKEYILEEGDILFARSGATVGKAFQFKNYIGQACFAGYLIKASPNEKLILSDFLYLYTQSSFFEDWKNLIFNKATIENIGADKYSILEVILPSIEQQNIIAKNIKKDLSNIDKAIEKAKIEIEKAKEYQESLITQIITGQLRIPEQKVKSSKVNWEFKEAVLIAFLTKKCATIEYPLGRKRYTKFSYLFHRHTDNRIEKYRNKAAGPYNPETKYKGPEKIAKQNKYIQESKRGKFNGFIPDENIEKSLDYFNKYWTEEDVVWFEKIKFLSNDKLELIATVDKAILDLQKQNKAISFENVKNYIRESEEWKAKLKREVFSDSNIRQTIKDLDIFFS